jgi:HAE1 family hydrophobic/amphiphilic exporter-1
VNGVDNMLYMTSQSTSDGSMSLAVTFKLGTNLDTAQVLVQNRVATALPRLPEEVRSIGVTVTKQSPDLMMVIHLSSPDGSRDLLYISNYATLHVRDVLSRIDGVGNVTIFGARDYSMRIWLDPEKLAVRNLDRGRRGQCAARSERAGGSRRDQPAAGAATRRLSAQRRDPGTPD